MDETAETALVAELALTETMVRLAINMAIQIIIAEGGNMTKVRQLVANIQPSGALAPAIPIVTPAAAKGYDRGVALTLVNTKAAQTADFIAEQAAGQALRMGIKLSR